jgi:uncharacterized protein DUF3105
MWAVGGGLVVAIVAAVILLGGGSDKGTESVAAAMRAAGCTYRDVDPLPPKDKNNFHADVKTLTSKVKWSTFPPSAGSHYGNWAIWGFYRSPVNPREVVHNEEHGGVVIWWGPKVPASTVDQLDAFYTEKADSMFGTPIAKLGNKIAITAWTGDPDRYSQRGGYYGVGHIAICSGFDEKAFRTFRDAYRGEGPERIPTELNKPGTGP